MKTEQKIYVALGLLAAAGGGLWWTQQNKAKDTEAHSASAVTSDLPSFNVPKDEIERITKIELSSPNKEDKDKKTSVTLEKKGEDWELTAPVSAKANAANIRSLLDNLKELKAKEAIDRGTGAYAQYDLTDDKAVHLVAFKGADKAADLYFGKSGSRGQMARVGGKDGVYVVSGYSSFLYAREPKNWRETSILKFEDANAIQVEVTNENGLFSFSKNDDKWSGSFAKRDKSGKLGTPSKDWKKFDEAKVKDMLRAYKSLNAEDFGTEKDLAESGVNEAETAGGVVHVKLKDNAGDLTIKVGKSSKGSSRWAIKEGGDGTLYQLSSWSADWATAKPEKFEKADDKKKDEKKGDVHEAEHLEEE